MSDDKQGMNDLFGGAVTGGFLDLPRGSPGYIDGADIVLLGAPCATPYQSVGSYCHDAPAAIRAAFGWPGVIQHYDFDREQTLLHKESKAIDWGDLEWKSDDFNFNRSVITKAVKSVLEGQAVPLVLGGDDSIPIPILQAYEQHGPLTIVQIDAHIDWRHEVAGETLGLSSNMRRASEMPWVERIIQVGARGIGSARVSDIEDAKNWGVSFFPMRQLAQEGLQSVIEAIPENASVYIALDIDAFDPAVVPSVIGPAPGGFNYWQMVELLEGICGRSRVAGFNLAELMPSKDVGGRGALVAARMTAIMLSLVSSQVAEHG